MRWYVYYTLNGHGVCKCFDYDEATATSFAKSVNGTAYAGL